MGKDGRKIIITTVHGLEYSAELQKELNGIGQRQDADAQIVKLKQEMKEGKNAHLLLENDVLFKRGYDTDNWKVIIPNGMANRLSRETHEVYGHMHRIISEVVCTRNICQREKPIDFQTDGPMTSH